MIKCIGDQNRAIQVIKVCCGLKLAPILYQGLVADTVIAKKGAEAIGISDLNLAVESIVGKAGGAIFGSLL